jgi:hypothetical protein
MGEERVSEGFDVAGERIAEARVGGGDPWTELRFDPVQLGRDLCWARI